jgi:hypothetical protein
VPDQSMILDGPTHGGAKVRAARATDGSFAFIYSPRGEPFTLRVNVIRTPMIRQTWFDPRDGTARPLHTTDTPGFQTFVPPTRGRGCDWMLVLDDATAATSACATVRPALTPEESPAGVSFQSSSNRTYTLWSTPQLVSPDWAVVPGQETVPGNGGTLTLSDPTSALRQFYRVEVSLP